MVDGCARQVECHERDVVLIARRVRERHELGDEAVEPVGAATAAEDGRDKAILAEHAIGAAGLGHTVGVKQKRVSRPQPARGLVTGNAEQGRGEDRARGIEQNRLRRADADDPLGVAGVDIAQLARGLGAPSGSEAGG